jgi:hypothetical protein
MGIGDPATPVDSDVEINSPTPLTGNDQQKRQGDRLTVIERAGKEEIFRQIKWLYDNLPGGPYTYPPPP